MLKNKTEEYILCSAIWYKEIPLKVLNVPNQNPINVDKGAVFCGCRHSHCMWTMYAITGIKSKQNEIGMYTQGFLTSKNRFVDREEGGKIAFYAGQTKELKTTLYSEDLW